MLLYIYLAVLLLLAATFTALEIAFFSMEEIEFMVISHGKHKNAKRLMQLKAEKDNLLLSILICTNAITISASALNAYISYNLAIKFNFNPDYFVSLATVILTFTIIIFCEAIPKIIGMRLRQEICLFFSPFLLFINNVAKPFTAGLLFVFLSFNKLKSTLTKTKPEYYQKAFVGLTKKSVEEGLIGQNEGELIGNVMALNRSVLTIMRPRNQVFSLQSDLKIKDTIQALDKKNYSRIPIFLDNMDNINGIVRIRNIFDAYLQNKDDLTLLDIADTPIFIKDSWTIWHVLNILRAKKSHLGIVIDEFGGTSGIITLEDILEELVGEIDDEKDATESKEVETISDNHWISQGSVEIRTINKILDLNLPENESYETLQGFLMDRLKRIPALHDQVVFDGKWLLVVNKMEKNEVKVVAIFKQPTTVNKT